MPKGIASAKYRLRHDCWSRQSRQTTPAASMDTHVCRWHEKLNPASHFTLLRSVQREGRETETSAYYSSKNTCKKILVVDDITVPQGN